MQSEWQLLRARLRPRTQPGVGVGVGAGGLFYDDLQYILEFWDPAYAVQGDLGRGA